LNEQKKRFAIDTEMRTLEDAMKGADIFLGFSAPNCVTAEMVKSMNKGAIIFAMANPVPEIMPDIAVAAGAAVVGTGRSDFANQINNVLGFPGIFRGALDVRATDINEAMKLAASEALAELAAEKIDDEVKKDLAIAYPADTAAGMFDADCPLSTNYVIPKPFDIRVVPRVARKVAAAAMKTGVARIAINDLDAYEKSVAARIAKAQGK
jgi:malate dehydrogenase (oxaloacetate-decarboxylating)(NADP+)